MRTVAIILGLALQAAQAAGTGGSKPDTSAHGEASSDLDFLTYDAGKAAPAPAPRPARGWIYWTAAAAVAACGGAGWYWYEAQAKPAVNRNYQVFDAR